MHMWHGNVGLTRSVTVYSVCFRSEHRIGSCFSGTTRRTLTDSNQSTTTEVSALAFEEIRLSPCTVALDLTIHLTNTSLLNHATTLSLHAPLHVGIGAEHMQIHFVIFYKQASLIRHFLLIYQNISYVISEQATNIRETEKFSPSHHSAG